MVGESQLHDWSQIVRGEYEESPGLQLTRPEFEASWGFDAGTADALLRALVAAGILEQTPRGAYVRARTRADLLPCPPIHE